MAVRMVERRLGQRQGPMVGQGPAVAGQRAVELAAAMGEAGMAAERLRLRLGLVALVETLVGQLHLVPAVPSVPRLLCMAPGLVVVAARA